MTVFGINNGKIYIGDTQITKDLPNLDNPVAETDILKDKDAINQDGDKIVGTAVLSSLEINSNGKYIPTTPIIGYNQVLVNVPTTGGILQSETITGTLSFLTGDNAFYLYIPDFDFSKLVGNVIYLSFADLNSDDVFVDAIILIDEQEDIGIEYAAFVNYYILDTDNNITSCARIYCLCGPEADVLKINIIMSLIMTSGFVAENFDNREVNVRYQKIMNG